MSTELNLFDMPGAPERPLDDILSPEDIMYVQDLKMHFPVTKGLLKRQVGAVKAVDGVTFQYQAWPDAGHRGRVRFWQVHHWQLSAAQYHPHRRPCLL